MFEIYNRKGSNDTFDDHHGQITQKDQPCRGHKPSFVNASARAVKIPEIRTALKPPQKPASFLAFCSPTYRL